MSEGNCGDGQGSLPVGLDERFELEEITVIITTIIVAVVITLERRLSVGGEDWRGRVG